MCEINDRGLYMLIYVVVMFNAAISIAGNHFSISLREIILCIRARSGLVGAALREVAFCSGNGGFCNALKNGVAVVNNYFNVMLVSAVRPYCSILLSKGCLPIEEWAAVAMALPSEDSTGACCRRSPPEASSSTARR